METLMLYCERTHAGLGAEPLNAISNVAFFVAAGAAWRAARKLNRVGASARWLVAVIVAIGIGSTLFHTFATNWARVLDLTPILIFQLSFLWLYGRRVIGWGAWASGALLVGFVAAAYAAGREFPHLLNRSLLYAPGFLCNLGLGIYHAYVRKAERFLMLAAAGVLTLALFFRTIDRAVCASFPLGTHFLWHLLIPLVLYLAVRALLPNMPESS